MKKQFNLTKQVWSAATKVVYDYRNGIKVLENKSLFKKEIWYILDSV